MTTRSHCEYLSLHRSSCQQLLHCSCTKERKLYLRVGASTLVKVSPGLHETCQENTVRRLHGDGGAFARSGYPRGRRTWTQVSLLETGVRHSYLAALLQSILQHLQGAIVLEEIPKLIAYMTTIIRVNRECSGSEWRNYDTLFQKLEALRRDTKWSVINPTIYARCFTVATRNPPRCELCLAFSHDTRYCSQRDIVECSIKGWLKSMEQTMQALVPTKPHPSVKSSGEVCRKWKWGECNCPYCRHTHVCSSCRAPHPIIQCPRYSRRGPDGNPPPWESHQDRADY